jgi:hypothetical protein
MPKSSERRDPTREEVIALLSYDPDSGQFIWTKSRPRVRAGTRAGGLIRLAYRAIRINGVLVMEHRLAFLIMTGRMPPEVDHVNGTTDDNRWANLREATRAQNVWNTKKGSRNTSGIKGVCWHAQSSNWRARIMVDGRRITLGLFRSKEDAAEARRLAERRYYGDFAKAA